MKHRINKMAAIFIVAIFALSGLGISYAAWTDTITIDGTVTTGVVEWEFGTMPPTVFDPFAPPPYYPPDPYPPDWNCDPNLGFNGPYPQPYPVEKNVGWGQTSKVDHDTLQLNIYNAYPGYYNHLDFWVHCLGMIPIKTDHAVVRDSSGAILVTINGIGLYEFNIDGQDGNDMQIWWGDKFGDQLHYCEQLDISFGFCFLQPLPQDSIITIYIDLVCVQWNEYPYTP